MADLSTTYLGLQLRSPLILASSTMSSRVEQLQQAEQYGAGAVVLRSLFEEQIEAVNTAMEEAAALGAESTPEATSYFPRQSAGPQEYLQFVSRAKKAVGVPVIASLNCAAPGSWSEYAPRIEEAGADALEVNIYAVQANVERSAADVEREYEEIISAIRSSVKIPIAVKLSPFFTALASSIARYDAAGVNGFVLFNRFLQPDIALDKLTLRNDMSLSHPNEMLLPLRWIALLHGRVKADLAGSTGVHDWQGVAKMILAGANVVQVASALVKNGVGHMDRLRQGLEQWMDGRGYSTIDDFRGTMSDRTNGEPGAFARAQYVSLLAAQNA
jgi:dihydroorotate dehydrogenase (fumarate)